MWNSVTLKRSLAQISKAKPIVSGAGRSFGSTSRAVFSQQSESAIWETTEASNNSNTNNILSNEPPTTTSSGTNSSSSSGNGIIRFTMTPKPQQTRTFGTSLLETSTIQESPQDEAPPLQTLRSSSPQLASDSTDAYLYDDCDEDLSPCNVYYADQGTAAEHMAKLMEDSYYYASFRATEEESTH